MTTESEKLPLRITLFGPMQALVRGKPLPPLRSRKSLYLLALLALRHNCPVEREWLAGTLWPDVDQSQSFANLRPALSALREALGEESHRLESPNRRTLMLNLTSGAEADVATFDAAIANGQLAALEQALALYRGPLLEGCAEEWVVQDRDAREQACLKALQTLATAAFEAGNYTTSADYWRRAIALDPFRDAARRGAMAALIQQGDSNAALQVYREFVAALQSADVRAAPDAETTALYRRLREGARQKANASPTDTTEAAIPHVSHNLPHALTELIGRDDESVEVATRLRRSRLVTLTGPGGIGKTRLAVAVAQEVVREYADGVYLVGLESLPPAGGSGDEEWRPALQQIAAALGVKEGMRGPLRSVVTEHLRRKRLLLVLDNCEHVLEPCAGIIALLLRECLGVRILATSREALRIGGEIAWAVPALAAPDSEHLPKGGAALVRAMSGYDAVRLFVARAEAVDKQFTLTGGNAQAVAALCVRLAGVPLALELAAARTTVLTPAQILAQFDARPLDALASRQRDIVPRHRTLRATLEWSYGLLPPEAQTFLADLGVFRGGWTLVAAQAVCPDADAVEMLTLLRDASLISVTADAVGERFSMLETVRHFAVETLEQSGRADAVRRRHAQHYAEWLVAEYQEPRRFRFFVSVERDYANMTAALHGAMSSADDELFSGLCHDLTGFWEHTGRIGESRYWMEIVARRLIATGNDNLIGEGVTGETGAALTPLSPAQTKLIDTQIPLLSASGNFEAAAQFCIRIFQDYLHAGNGVGGRTHLFNAGVFLLSSDLNRSLMILEQCLPLERATRDDGRANPVILSQLALVSRLTDQAERAAAYLSEALEVCRGREESDAHGYGRAMWIAGLAALAEDDFALAAGRFETAASVARERSISILETYALCGLAALARQTGEYERHEALLAEATAAAGPTPAIRLEPTLRRERAEQFLIAQDRMGAAAFLRDALNLLRGNARSLRLYAPPLLLLLTEAECSGDSEAHRAGRAARLIGAADGIAARLGLLATERAERERADRLRSHLLERLGAERLLREEAAGAALDDEAALEFALAAS